MPTPDKITCSRVNAALIENPAGSSLKRIAWAYGCAKKGTDEERELLRILLARVAGGAST